MPSVASAVDWPMIEAQRDRLVEGGRLFFDNAIGTMRSSGIDVRDPAAVLVVVKRLGAAACEELFGAGQLDEAYPRRRRPVIETDLVHRTMAERSRLLDFLHAAADTNLHGLRVVLASTDVHEFAKFLLESTLVEAGARVIDAGVNRDPEDIVNAAVESAAQAIVVTTHNGVARSFAQVLRKELESVRLGAVPVYMGGVINEDIEGSEIPVDVRGDLRALGVAPLATVEELIENMASLVRTNSGATA